LFSDESGATVVEHAIMVCVIALVIVSLAGSGLTPRGVLRSAGYLLEAALSGGDASSTATASVPPAGD
jgi:Flp pilus assembly pilin Flp